MSNYAETGELIHPRFERRERTISEMPDIPMAYASAGAIVRAAETGLGMPPLPDDLDDAYASAFEEGPEDLAAAKAAERRRSSPRRRLATGPRPSK